MRNAQSCILLGIVVATWLGAMGCERPPSDTPRFNESLGGSSVGAPPAARAADTGILADQSAYQPAKFTAAGAGGGDDGGAGDTGAESPEAAEIRKVADGLLTGIFEIDVDLILDSFEEEKIAALREDDYLSTMYETADTLKTFWRVLKSKSEGTDVEPLLHVIELVPTLKGPLVSAMDVRMVDDTHAVSTLNQARFASDGASAMAEIQTAAMAAMPAVMGAIGKAMGGEGPPPEFSPDDLTSAMAMNPVQGQGEESPLVKTAGGWRLVVPVPVTEEVAEIVNEALLLAKEYLGEVTSQIDQTTNFDLAALIEIGQRVGMAKAPQAMGLFGRAQMLLGPMLGPGEMPMGEPGEGEAPTDPNTGEPSDNPRMRPTDPG